MARPSQVPTDTFKILLQCPDGGIKHKKRLKIFSILTGIFLFITLLAMIIAISAFAKNEKQVTNKVVDKSTLLLIGGKNENGDFVNEVEVIGYENCPKLEM